MNFDKIKGNNRELFSSQFLQDGGLGHYRMKCSFGYCSRRSPLLLLCCYICSSNWELKIWLLLYYHGSFRILASSADEPDICILNHCDGQIASRFIHQNNIQYPFHNSLTILCDCLKGLTIASQP